MANSLQELVQANQADKLGQGCYSRVHAHKQFPKWVIKQGNNDRTRTYLEWCKEKQNKGEWMRGMPIVDFVIPLGTDMYLAVMRRYQPIKIFGGVAAFGWTPNTTYSLHERDECPQYLKDLADAFKQETGMLFDDFHYENIMVDDSDPAELELIATDPSASAYKPLHGQQYDYRQREFEFGER